MDYTVINERKKLPLGLLILALFHPINDTLIDQFRSDFRLPDQNKSAN
jgi:hypothetical protein